MSDMITSQPVTSTSSTSEIAAQVVAEAESATDDTTPSTPSEPVAEAEPESIVVATPSPTGSEPASPVAPVAATPPADPDDLSSIPSELTSVDGRKRENRIPYSKVQKIVENAQTKATEPLNQKITDYEQRLQDIAQVEQIMANDPERFLSMLPQLNPRYAQLIQQGQGNTQQQPQRTPQSERPQPNVRLSDGSTTYDTEGLERLMDWQAQQVEARLEAKYTERFGPIEQDYRAQRIYQETLPRVQAQLAAAEKWPLFNENRAEILKVLQSSPSISLEAGYQHVVYPKIQSDRNKIRAEVLAELKAQPTSTSAPTSSTPSNPSGGRPRSTEDIAREILKNSK